MVYINLFDAIGRTVTGYTDTIPTLYRPNPNPTQTQPRPKPTQNNIMAEERDFERFGNPIEILDLDDGTRTVTIRYRTEIIDVDPMLENLEPILRRIIQDVQGDVGNNRYAIMLLGERSPDVLTNLNQEIDRQHANRNFFSSVHSDNPLRQLLNVFGRHVREYDTQGINTRIREIWITFYVPSDELLRSGKNWHMLCDKWLVISPKSRINCLFTSIAIGLDFKSDRKLLTDVQIQNKKGRRLKEKFERQGYNFSYGVHLSDMQYISNELFLKINVYDNIFKKIETFIPQSGEYINKIDLQKINNHVCCMIERSLIESTYPNLFPDPDKDKRIVQQLGYVVKKKSKINIYELNCSTVNGENNILFDNKIYDSIHDLEDMISKKKFKLVLGTDIEALPLKYKKFPDKQLYWKFGSFDLESARNEMNYQTCYASGFAWYDKNDDIGSDPNYVDFWGRDSVKNLFTFLFERRKEFDKYTIYAHNGGKFDLPIVLREYLLDNDDKWSIVSEKTIEFNGAFIAMRIISKDGKIIDFRDSFRMIPSSLENMCKDLKTRHQKLTETVDHDQITLDNFHRFPELKKYLEHDCKGLLEGITKFNKSIFDHEHFNIHKCYTQASLAKKSFNVNYYNPNRDNFYIWNLTDEQDKYCRNAYFGGRNECFMIGIVKNVYYYDFTSEYPDVGRNLLPQGEAKFCKNMDKFLDKEGLLLNHREKNGFFGIIRCKVKTKRRDIIPLLCCKKDGRLIFPIFENWTEIYCTSPEVLVSQKHGIYEFKFLDGYRFDFSHHHLKFFENGFKTKCEATKNGEDALVLGAKVMINSEYGRYGIRTKERDGIIIFKNGTQSFLEYLYSNQLISMKKGKKYTLLRIRKDLDIPDRNVSIATFITAYARLKTWEAMVDFGKYGDVIYCDTDSIMTTTNMSKYPELMKKYQHDGTGEALGLMKDECSSLIKKKTKDSKENLLLKERILEGSIHIPFDVIKIAGCKQYYCKKTLKCDPSRILEIKKWKGFKEMLKLKTNQYNQSIRIDKEKHMEELDIEDDGYFDEEIQVNLSESLYDKLISRKPIVHEQVIFKSGKESMMSEEKNFGIQTKTVSKRFNFVYSKGIVNLETGKISPLVI